MFRGYDAVRLALKDRPASVYDGIECLFVCILHRISPIERLQTDAVLLCARYIPVFHVVHQKLMRSGLNRIRELRVGNGL